jgi:predicted amidophosphoribosyltransferase
MDTKKCPFCGKTVLAISKVCKHCRKSFEITNETVSAEIQSQTPIQNNDLRKVIEEIKRGNKLAAVKLLKDATGWELKESKDWIDSYCENKTPQYSSVYQLPAVTQNATNYQQQQTSTGSNKLGFFLGVVCFLIPVVGLIVFLVTVSNPGRANKALIAGINGFILGLILMNI